MIKKAILLVVIIILCYTVPLASQMRKDFGEEYWNSLSYRGKEVYLEGVISGMYAFSYGILEYLTGDTSAIYDLVPTMYDDHPFVHYLISVEMAYMEDKYSSLPIGFIIFYKDEIIEDITQRRGVLYIEVKAKEIIDRYKGE